MSGTSRWQWGHQCATKTIAVGRPDGSMATGLPSNEAPWTVGAVMPTAGSLPEAGNGGRGAPVIPAHRSVRPSPLRKLQPRLPEAAAEGTGVEADDDEDAEARAVEADAEDAELGGTARRGRRRRRRSQRGAADGRRLRRRGHCGKRAAGLGDTAADDRPSRGRRRTRSRGSPRRRSRRRPRRAASASSAPPLVGGEAFFGRPAGVRGGRLAVIRSSGRGRGRRESSWRGVAANRQQGEDQQEGGQREERQTHEAEGAEPDQRARWPDTARARVEGRDPLEREMVCRDDRPDAREHPTVDPDPAVRAERARCRG